MRARGCLCGLSLDSTALAVCGVCLARVCMRTRPRVLVDVLLCIRLPDRGVEVHLVATLRPASKALIMSTRLEKRAILSYSALIVSHEFSPPPTYLHPDSVEVVAAVVKHVVVLCRCVCRCFCRCCSCGGGGEAWYHWPHVPPIQRSLVLRRPSHSQRLRT